MIVVFSECQDLHHQKVSQLFLQIDQIVSQEKDQKAYSTSVWIMRIKIPKYLHSRAKKDKIKIARIPVNITTTYKMTW